MTEDECMSVAEFLAAMARMTLDQKRDIIRRMQEQDYRE